MCSNISIIQKERIMTAGDIKIRETLQETVVKFLRFLRWLTACLVLLYVFSGVYSISSNEVGILQRFGRVVNDNIQPGVHFALPWPIDCVTKVPIRVMHRMLIDDFFSDETDTIYTSQVFSRMTGLDSYCLTGENNLVNVMCVIQYNIIEPAKYLFCISKPDVMLRSMACNTIIRCLANMPIDEALTRGKRELMVYVKSALQHRLDVADTGISISFIEISSIKPPERVQDVFSDVVKANIDREKMINEAVAYRNEQIPAANARAERILQEAEAYKTEVVLKAEGETARFLKLLERTREKDNSVRQLMYIETLKKIMKNVGEKHFMICDERRKGPAHIRIFSKP